jgi:predicted metal-dependent enzyme (double-stranded beta helix superfamily)
MDPMDPVIKRSTSLSQLVAAMRRVTAETDHAGSIVNALSGPVRDAALAKDWVADRHFACDAEQGFGVHLLHEEPDHSLAVLAVAWLPGRGAPVHDHGTWAVVGGVEGVERNRHWRRVDDGARPGYAELREIGADLIGPGEVLPMLPSAIHSVANETEARTLSLHVYGVHPNHTERSQYDVAAKTEQAFHFKQEEA